MNEPKAVHDLEELLDRIDQVASEHTPVTLHDVLHAVGQRSFGPWLLIIGLITLSPVGDIPGVPTLMAVVILLVAVQLLIGVNHFWLPRWLMQRSASRERLRRSVRWLRKPARGVDRLLKPRLEIFTGGIGQRIIAVLCVVIALGLPPMEFVPFSATGAGLALTGFGLALIADDGLLAAISAVLMVATYGLVGWQLLAG